MSDSLLGVPDVEESFSVPKVMADICPIPLTMVPEIDNSLSGAAMGHFIIAKSGGDTTDANLDSSQIETSVAYQEKYQYCSLMIDGMSLKEGTLYDKHLKYGFDFCDYGNLDLEMKHEGEKAKEALVVLLVGLKAKFKLPLAYLTVRRSPSNVIAEIIKEALNQCHKVGIKILSVVADGTAHNVSDMNILGARMNLKNKLSWISPFFTHPSDHWLHA